MNSKNKGNSFERKIANLLSLTFKDHLGIEQGFRRNPDSGSFFGGTNKFRTQTHDLDHAIFGDLICPDAFKFTVECKHYKSPPTFKSFINGEVSQWDKWLEQAADDAKAANKSAMLIIKYNQVDELVFVTESFPLTSPFSYNGYNAYKLSDVLTLNISTFF